MRTSALATALTLLPCALLAQKPKTPPGAHAAGFVVELSGSWHTKGRLNDLAVGDSVLAGDTVVAGAKHTDTQHITVVARGAKAMSAKCGEYASRCGQIVVSAPKGHVSERLSRALASVAALFRGHDAQRYASLVSRGDTPLNDAVVPLRDGSVDLREVFRGQPNARYDICVARFTEPKAADESAQPDCTVQVTREWRSAQPLNINLKAPGLYQVRVGDVDAWIYTSSDYASDSALFATLVDDVRDWDVTASTKRSYLRGCLIAITLEHESAK